MVNVTTDKCYENRDWVWGYRETDALGGRDPYSNSKACAELVGQSYRDSFFPLSHVADHGVAIASGFIVSRHLGLLLFLAVFFHKLPEGLAMEQAALTEPCCVAYNAVINNARIRPGDRVIVLAEN